MVRPSWVFFPPLFPDNFLLLLQQKTTFKIESLFNSGILNGYLQSLCHWHSKKRQKSAVSGSCSIHHDVLCAALYISGVVRKRNHQTLSISAHFYPAQRRGQVLCFVNTSNLFCINMFVLFEGILNYASQFSHTAWKYQYLNTFFW